MALTQAQTGIITVNGTFRESLSGDGRSGGETLTFNNTIVLPSANIDGWYSGEGSITRAGSVTYYGINLGATDPLGALGAGTFNLGFTSDGTYCPFVYFELLTNTTGPGAGGVNLQIYDYASPTPTAFLGLLTNPGDFWINYASNTSTALSSLDANSNYSVFLDGNATVTFKIVAFMRTAQYPV